MSVRFKNASVSGFEGGPSKFRKSLMPVIFPPAILRPETAAPILWALGIYWFFLLENPHAHKIPRFRGGFFERGGGSADLFFVSNRIFEPILIKVAYAYTLRTFSLMLLKSPRVMYESASFPPQDPRAADIFSKTSGIDITCTYSSEIIPD